jgi:uncharacterized membrane protein
MITGNPRVGRAMLTLIVAIVIAVVLTAALFMSRKRVEPSSEPPLHSAVQDLLPVSA